MKIINLSLYGERITGVIISSHRMSANEMEYIVYYNNNLVKVYSISTPTKSFGAIVEIISQHCTIKEADKILENVPEIISVNIFCE